MPTEEQLKMAVLIILAIFLATKIIALILIMPYLEEADDRISEMTPEEQEEYFKEERRRMLEAMSRPNPFGPP